MAAFSTSQPNPGSSERVAESVGRCIRCHGIIQRGDTFHWTSGKPPQPVCKKCQGKR